MIKRILLVLFLIMASVAVYAADSYQSLRVEYDQMLTAGKAVRNKYMNMGDRFYRAYTSAPNSADADKLLYYAGKCYKLSYENYSQKNDYDIAQKYFRTLYTNYISDSAAEAYLESAELFTLVGELASAQQYLLRLKQKYPNTVQEVAANSMLVDLEKMDKGGYAEYVKNNPDNPKVDNPYTTPPEVIDVVLNQPVVVEQPVVIDVPSGDDNGIGMAETPSIVVPEGIAAIKAIRYYSNDEYTRVVIDLTKGAEFNKHWLKENPEFNSPPRLYVDVFDSIVESTIPRETPVKDGVISSIRWGYNKPGTTRVVLESESIKDFTVFQMENPARIVIDVTKGDAVSPKPPVPDEPRDPKDPDLGPLDPKIICALGLGVKTIVIDPGHGGKDPGCNYFGMKEKDIVLEIAKELRTLIQKNNPAIKVILTRETDVFIPLEERTAIANKNKADLFISVHINATKNGVASGVETYFLNTTSDKSALEVAAFENQATTKAISDLQGILVDLMSNTKRAESAKLAGYVQSNICSSAKLSGKQNHGVKSAPFYVLVGATMPAVLVEAGFLSNKDDSAKLKTSAHRKLIAKGIYNGIAEYIAKMCPQ